MKRSILAALGTVAVIASAAALGIGVAAAPETQSPTRTQFDAARAQGSARNAQRARIDARYQVERASCAALGGIKRDRCLIDAHASRGRALLEAAAPYETS